jgi:hypothetical protein
MYDSINVATAEYESFDEDHDGYEESRPSEAPQTRKESESESEEESEEDEERANWRPGRHTCVYVCLAV